MSREEIRLYPSFPKGDNQGYIFLMIELFSKLTKTVAPAEAGVQKRMKGLDSGFRRDDDDGLLQSARMGKHC